MDRSTGTSQGDASRSSNYPLAGRLQTLSSKTTGYGADHAFGDPTRQQIACNWRAIDLTDFMDKRDADFAERSAVGEHEHRSRFYGIQCSERRRVALAPYR